MIKKIQNKAETVKTLALCLSENAILIVKRAEICTAHH